MAKIERKKRRRYRASTHRRHTKRVDVVSVAGLALGEYLTLSAGDGSIDTVKQTVSNPAEALRQQLLGMVGYDIETKQMYLPALARFWGPIVGLKVFSMIAKKVLGTSIKIDRHFRVF